MSQIWYLDRKNWIKTLAGECCSVTELMGKQEEDGSWTYAIVTTSKGLRSLKAIFNSGKLLE